MPIEVAILDETTEAPYRDFVSGLETPLVYASLEYRAFLQRALPKSRDVYLLAVRQGRIIGALPTFLSGDAEDGPLMNSLPFFGSHGGIIGPADIDQEAESALIAQYCRLELDNGVAASTLVESPLCPLSESARTLLQPTHEDSRIGQFTPLSQYERREEAEAAILGACHQKTRNAIRKALKLQSRIERSESEAAIQWLFEQHRRGMTELGGVVKPLQVFAALVSELAPSGGCRIYRAFVDGEPAAAVLLLYFNDTVEYFTPVTSAQHKSSQILSALIFHCMTEASLEGYRKWNWGGTWASQEGVYRFKSRWNAESMPYRYHIKLRNPSLTRLNPHEIRDRYPFFYAFPFSAVTATTHA